jgi:hypothetical protein
MSTDACGRSMTDWTVGRGADDLRDMRCLASSRLERDAAGFARR